MSEWCAGREVVIVTMATTAPAYTTASGASRAIATGGEAGRDGLREVAEPQDALATVSIAEGRADGRQHPGR